jgi:hypothetical protein
MIDDSNECNCLTFKKLFEAWQCGQTLSVSEQSRFDLHRQNCLSCSTWLSQHAEIAEMSRHLPQFDVSEGLTQKIMDSIEKQSLPGVQLSLLPIGLASCLVFFVMVPFDSWQSLYGWGAGIMGLVALQLLMKTANKQEQVI